jgi:hypothetical protein
MYFDTKKITKLNENGQALLIQFPQDNNIPHTAKIQLE